jgi:hypothetical protein
MVIVIHIWQKFSSVERDVTHAYRQKFLAAFFTNI